MRLTAVYYKVTEMKASKTYPTVLFILLVLNDVLLALKKEDGKCVPLVVDHCRDLQYNATLIPNIKTNVDTMDEASRRVSEFSPLFKINCYENFKYFICNMFLPVCHNINGNPTPIFPCQEVCRAARSGCEPLMKKYSFQWPDVLRCEYLKSVNDEDSLCGSPPAIKPPSVTTTPAGSTNPTASKELVIIIEQFPKNTDWTGYLSHADNWQRFAKLVGLDPTKRKKMDWFCGTKSLYIKKDDTEQCATKCDATLTFTSADKKFATVWISVWSVICFLSTTLTVMTFLIDHKRFKYPERPIIFLSFCYNLYSIGYLIRVFAGYDKVICENSSQGKHVVIEGMSVTSCTLVFFFLYFFGMASALWWVILSLTWFLSAALKWGHEAIEKYASVFHAISWTVPTIQTIIALVTRKVDADVLSGLCYVGNENSDDLLLFVALPLLIYLLIGTIFLSMGFIALIKIRKALRKERNTNKFERLMLRIGVFSVLYSVPASVVVGCFIHEYNRMKYRDSKTKDMIACLTDKHCIESLKPSVELFYLRYFMLLVVGVTSGVWIWTSKTLNSWKKFYERRQSKRKPEEAKRLYKNPIKVNISDNRPTRRASEVENHYQPITSVHGSSNNMNQQGYVPPPNRFFFPYSTKCRRFHASTQCSYPTS